MVDAFSAYVYRLRCNHTAYKRTDGDVICTSKVKVSADEVAGDVLTLRFSAPHPLHTPMQVWRLGRATALLGTVLRLEQQLLLCTHIRMHGCRVY